MLLQDNQEKRVERIQTFIGTCYQSASRNFRIDTLCAFYLRRTLSNANCRIRTCGTYGSVLQNSNLTLSTRLRQVGIQLKNVMGLEPTIFGFEDRYLIQLGYTFTERYFINLLWAELDSNQRPSRVKLV
jgi:hypothetical protein